MPGRAHIEGVFMIIVKERLNLDEMAQFRGAGIVIEVRSNDHGKLGSKTDPAHAHVFDSSGRQELAQIVLSINPPEKASDIQWYRTEDPPDGLGKKILNFAATKNTKIQKLGIVETNWSSVIRQWVYFHEA
jgi:hypothetical protein